MPTSTATRESDAPGRVDLDAPRLVAGGMDRPERRIDRHRLRGRATTIALVAAAVAAIGEAFGAVVIGRLADDPDALGVLLLAACVVGAALLDTVGRAVWAGVVDRAEGQLRADLLDAVMHQPLTSLTEQAVGEILDRVDDDTHEVGVLLRQSAWRVIRLALVAVPLLVVAGFTWWPAWLLFPITAALTAAVVRPLLGELAERKVLEEAAWTDHAAAMEEGIAARDDLRTSLGQAYVVRRSAELAAVVHERLRQVVVIEAAITRRAGVLLHGLLAGVAICGFALVAGGAQSTATLVTLFVVTTTFVGQIDQVARHLPDLQAGVGALVRLRGLLASVPEPAGGAAVPPGPLTIEFRDLHFAYPDGPFALDGVSLTVPAGTTCALVGRSGSGKSTLASLLSRAVDPAPGTVLLDGTDVIDLDLEALRSTVGLVTQRTEIIAGTLAENVALFADVDRHRVEQAIAELGLTDWVDGLPDGLDTVLGPNGSTLSAGEEQLVAFARLLVRDVRVIVLDEATARMDPLTEQRVIAAAQRLLDGRTGILIAHRLGTTERAEQIAVLDAGRIVQSGRRVELAVVDGPFRSLLTAAMDPDDVIAIGMTATDVAATEVEAATVAPTRDELFAQASIGGTRRLGDVPVGPSVQPPRQPPRLARATWNALRVRARWGLFSVALFLVAIVLGAYGAVTGWLWGHIVVDLQDDARPVGLLVALVASLIAAPLLLSEAIARYPRWWIEVMLRVRTSTLVGQTRQHRLAATPPGEVVARALDSDRFARYCDRWIDFVLGLVIASVTAVLGGTWLAGAVLLAVMLLSAGVSALGSPVAGRSATASADARAQFGRSLVSSLDAIRTVKLSGATSDVHRHLRRVDGDRVVAAVREHRVQSLLDGLPVVLVQVGVVAAWAIHVAGGWGLATALLVSGAVSGFDWFGRVAGAVITEAPGTRAWQQETSRLAGGTDLMELPAGVDLVTGAAPLPEVAPVDRLERLDISDMTVVHDDGTIGVRNVDVSVARGELVLLVGQIGSGKSSLLSAIAGLASYTGVVRWNGSDVIDAETFLRPGRVAHVAQVPRVLSGTFHGNIRLDHDRQVDGPVVDARLARDVADAGGVDAVVGHRGVRLSGGQVQRLALARALATEAEIIVADDVSSALDATTEIELWESLRARGRTVIGATSKRAALARADRVVVLVDGGVAAVGPWHEISRDWRHLAG